jgi:hypothetical protein
MQKTTKQTTTKFVHSKVEYITVRKEGYHDIRVKYVDGIPVKEFKVKNYL